MRYHFIIHREKKSLWAECVELKWCVTQSEDNSRESLRKNMEEALNLYLERLDQDEKIILPERTIKKRNIEAVRVEPCTAFSLLLRHERNKKGLAPEDTARLLGFNDSKSYQKLETPGANPEFTILEKIMKVFPGFDLNMLFN